MSDEEKGTEVPDVEGTGLRHSEEIEKIAAALAKVQGAVQDPKRVGKNPHFGSHYATLEEIIKSARPVLVEHGVTMIQAPSMEDNLVSVETMLVHESGQWFRNMASAPLQKADPQGVGSAITYLRRYSLSAMLGLAQEDDDGNAASSRKSVNGDRRESKQKVSKPDSSDVTCPDCGGPAWDNRDDDKAAANGGKRPNFKCQDTDDCDWASWESDPPGAEPEPEPEDPWTVPKRKLNEALSKYISDRDERRRVAEGLATIEDDLPDDISEWMPVDFETAAELVEEDGPDLLERVYEHLDEESQTEMEVGA